MGRQGRSISKEEEDKIKEYIEKGIRPNAIATKIKRSSNCVYEFVRKNNLSDKVAPYYTRQKTEDAERPPEYNLSQLPDTKLFQHVNWAIPILLIILFSSCYPARDSTTGKFWKSRKVLQRMTARNYNHCKIYYDLNNNPIPYK